MDAPIKQGVGVVFMDLFPPLKGARGMLLIIPLINYFSKENLIASFFFGAVLKIVAEVM